MPKTIDIALLTMNIVVSSAKTPSYTIQWHDDAGWLIVVLRKASIFAIQVASVETSPKYHSTTTPLINNDAINILSLTDPFPGAYEPQNVFRRLLERSSSPAIMVFVLIHSSFLTKCHIRISRVPQCKSQREVPKHLPWLPGGQCCKELLSFCLIRIQLRPFPTNTNLCLQNTVIKVEDPNYSLIVPNCSTLLLAPMTADKGCLFCPCISNSTPFPQISVSAVLYPPKYHSRHFFNCSEGISPNL